MKDKHQAPKPEHKKARTAYRKPGLREFGSVGKLTQAGTGTMAETGSMMNTMQAML